MTDWRPVFYQMKRRYSKPNKKKLYIPIVTGAIMVILGIQLISLYSKLSGYREREAYLIKEVEAAEQTAGDLEDYEAYTHSEEYICNTARTRLGLVKENEIIFKEN